MKTETQNTADQPHRLIFITVLAFLVLNLLFPGEANKLIVMITTVSIAGIALTHLFFFRQNAFTVRSLVTTSLFALALIVSQAASIYSSGSLRTSAYFVTLFLLIWLVSDFAWSNRQLMFFAWTVSIMAGLLSIYGLIQLFTFFDQAPDMELATSMLPVSSNYIELVFTQKRIFSTFVLPTSFSIFLAVSLPLTGGLFFFEKSWLKRGLLIAIALLTLAALVQSKSHGGVAALLGGGLVGLVVFLRSRRWSWRKIGYIAMVAVASALVLILIIGLIRNNFLWDLSHTNNPVKLRWHLWLAGAQIFAANLFTGIGSGNFPYALFPHLNELVRPTKYAHNSYLQLSLEWGLLGTLLLAVVLFILMRRGFSMATVESGRNMTLRLALVTSLFVYLGANLIEIVVYFPSLGFLGSVLIGLALRRPEKAQSQETLKPPLQLAVPAVVLTGLLIVSSLAWYSADRLYESVQYEFSNKSLASDQGQAGSIGTEFYTDSLNRLAVSDFLDHGDFRYHYLRSQLYSELASADPQNSEQYNQLALREMETAVELCPRQPNLRSRYATELARNRFILEASVQAEIAARLHPTQSEYQEAARLLKSANIRVMQSRAGREGQ